jgi:hypothetical protein
MLTCGAIDRAGVDERFPRPRPDQGHVAAHSAVADEFCGAANDVPSGTLAPGAAPRAPR